MSFVFAYLMLLKYCYLFVASIKVVYYYRDAFKDFCKLQKLCNITH